MININKYHNKFNSINNADYLILKESNLEKVNLIRYIIAKFLDIFKNTPQCSPNKIKTAVILLIEGMAEEGIKPEEVEAIQNFTNRMGIKSQKGVPFHAFYLQELLSKAQKEHLTSNLLERNFIQLNVIQDLEPLPQKIEIPVNQEEASKEKVNQEIPIKSALNIPLESIENQRPLEIEPPLEEQKHPPIGKRSSNDLIGTIGKIAFATITSAAFLKIWHSYSAETSLQKDTNYCTYTPKDPINLIPDRKSSLQIADVLIKGNDPLDVPPVDFEVPTNTPKMNEKNKTEFPAIKALIFGSLFSIPIIAWFNKSKTPKGLTDSENKEKHDNTDNTNIEKIEKPQTIPFKIDIKVLDPSDQIKIESDVVDVKRVDDDVLFQNFKGKTVAVALEKIKELGIEDKATLIKIAKIVATASDKNFLKRIREFRIIENLFEETTDEEQSLLIEILEITAEFDPISVCQDIGIFKIRDQDALIKIAKMIAIKENTYELLLRRLSNFNINDRDSLKDILKLVLQNYRFVEGEAFLVRCLHHLKELKIEDQATLFELLSIIIQQDFKLRPYEHEYLKNIGFSEYTEDFSQSFDNYQSFTPEQKLDLMLASLKGFEIDQILFGLPPPFEALFQKLKVSSDVSINDAEVINQAIDEALQLIIDTFPYYISDKICMDIKTEKNPRVKKELIFWLVFTLGSLLTNNAPKNLNDFFQPNLLEEIMACRNPNLRFALSSNLAKLFKEGRETFFKEFVASSKNSKHALFPAIILSVSKKDKDDVVTTELLNAIHNSREFREASKRDLLLKTLSKIENQVTFSPEDKSQIFNLLIEKKIVSPFILGETYPFLASYLDARPATELLMELSQQIDFLAKEIQGQSSLENKTMRNEISALAKRIKELEKQKADPTEIDRLKLEKTNLLALLKNSTGAVNSDDKTNKDKTNRNIKKEIDKKITELERLVFEKRLINQFELKKASISNDQIKIEHTSNLEFLALNLNKNDAEENRLLKLIKASTRSVSSINLQNLKIVQGILSCVPYLLKKESHANKDLKEIYLKAFAQIIPIDKAKGIFAETYPATFEKNLEERYAGALITYVGSLKKLNSPQKYLEVFGDYIYQVLSNSFASERYEGSLHLDTIFRENESLKEKWKKNTEHEYITGKDNENKYTIVSTDDPYDLLLCGTEVVGSCQRIDGDPQLNKCLLAYIVDGKNRLLAVKDQNGKIVARSILRLLWDESTQRPILLLEKVYSDSPITHEQALVAIAISESERLGIPIVSNAIGKKQIPYSYDLTSLSCKAPSEYVDSIRQEGLEEGETNGVFSIPAKCLYYL